MLIRFDYREHRILLQTLAQWIVLGALVGVLCGSASALFLWALNTATLFRSGHPWLFFLLPIAGIVIAWIYDRFGKSVAGGNNLLLETIHSEEETATTIPFRMAPLVLLTTVLTHLFGGSAGREGTAVQMGGTLANLLTRLFRLGKREHRLLIMAGISGGFGSVFGTPLAGTIFGLEVLSVGKLDYEALIPCFVAAYVGDIICRAWGITHHTYHVGVSLPTLSPLLWLLIVIAGLLFGGAALLFTELTEGISHVMKERIKSPLLRPFLGGIIIITLTLLLGTRDYLGLSLPLIERAFTPESVVPWAFALKLLFTAITLGSSFKGGEVTPLFCIGATLGAAFAQWTGQDTAFFAALGFVAVFAGAANTPLACAIMGMELFGMGLSIPLVATCLISYMISGHRGIYGSQLVGVAKAPGIIRERTQLRKVFPIEWKKASVSRSEVNNALPDNNED